MTLESLTKPLSKLPLPFPLPRTHQDRLAIVLGTTAALLSTALLPAIYRDYQTFKSYGPGGLPNNVIGWLTVRALFQPFKREMLSTEVYVKRIEAVEGHGKGEEAEAYLRLSEEQLAMRRRDGRPVVGPHVVPQRQVSQIPEEDVMEKFSTRFQSFGLRNYHLVKLEQSWLEKHSPALLLADHLPITDLAETMQGEIAHIHSESDHSVHAVLAPADCKKIIDAGWAQRHGFSGTSAMTYLSFGTLPDLPAEYILIYAPRTEAEIDVVMEIVAASVKFMSGREDVR